MLIIFSFQANSQSVSETVSIPDPNFEQALIDLGIDSDGTMNATVLLSDVQNIEVLEVQNRNISSLEGLSAFSNLKILRAWDNQLTSLDVSSNPNLVHLSVARNQITGLDLTNNTAVIELYAYENNLSSLLIPSNDQLKHLAVHNNQLTTLDLTGSSALVDINISENNLSEVSLGSHPDLVNLHAGGNSINALDVSNAPSLRLFLVWGNNLSEIDFTNNPLLAEIDLNVNNLSRLDLSNNHNLKFVLCNSNKLEYLNIANGNNALMASPDWGDLSLDAHNNPALRCIKVDSDMEGTTRSDWKANPGVLFLQDCTNLPTVYIPDANFEQALIEQGIDSDGIINQSILEVDAAVTTWLELYSPENGYGIQDLTGIEAFVNLTGINCSNNQISNLDFSANPKLQYIYANESEIQTINVVNNPNLINLHLFNNKISELDVRSNPQLKELIVQTNNITSLDLSANTNLTMAYCADNRLNSLNIANGNNLNFAPPEWGNLAFNADANPNLFCIQVDDTVLGNTPSDWQKDAHAVYNADCGTFVPEVTWGIVGSATPNGWEGPDIPMKYDKQSNTWSVSTELNNGEIKFRLNDDWSFNFGDGEWENRILDGILDRDGANIPVTAGQYNISINLDTYEYTLTRLNTNPSTIAGKWIIAPEPGALKVGPTPGSDGWWYLEKDEGEILRRACYMDDVYEFSEDGTFKNIQGNETILEPFQGVETQICGEPVSPHNGSIPANYQYDPENGTITLNGKGSFLGISSGVNGGSLPNVPIPESITYNVSFSENGNVMYVSLDIGNGFWTYKLVKDAVFMPDSNFEQALVDLGIDSDGIINRKILRSDAEAVSGMLNVSNKGISDLTGIEAFVNITELQAGDNALTSIDVSQNLKLEKIWVYSNSLIELDLSANVNMQRVSAPTNQLEYVNLNGLKNVHTVLLAQNNLKSLNLSGNPGLVRLALNANPIESLDVRNGNNSNVEYFYMPDTPNLTCINTDESISQVMIDSGKSFSNDCGDFVQIPDSNFEQALIDMGIDSDGVVNRSLLRSDAETTIQLDLRNPIYFEYGESNSNIINVTGKISDLSGIESFINLESLFLDRNQLGVLDLSNLNNLKEVFANENEISELILSQSEVLETISLNKNQLTSVDFSKTSNIKDLRVSYNNLSELNLTANSVLTSLSASGNNLSQLDISGFPDLTYLGIADNQLTELDLSVNSKLLTLTVNNNLLTELDISNNPDISQLSIDGLPLSTIDLSGLTNLQRFWASNTGLQKVDFTNNPNLIQLWMDNAQFESLDLSNNPNLFAVLLRNNRNLKHLDMRNGSNSKINFFWLHNTPQLSCINADANVSQAMLDSGKSFSENCGDFVYIPDPNFEQSLIDLGIDTDGVINTSILREDAEAVTELNLNNPKFDESNFANKEIVNAFGKIADLTGIETFVNLVSLEAAYGTLSEVDLSNNTRLEELFLNDNQLSGVDVSMLPNLKRFGIMRNPITSEINLAGNPALEELFVHYTGISSIDLSANPNLWNLFIQNNQLTSLDLSANRVLKRVSAQHNLLLELDITSLSLIERIDAQYNTSMTLITGANGNPTLTSLNLSGTGLSNFNGATYPNLEWLLLNDNSLSNFNGNNNLNLQNLFLNNNAITKLGLAGNTQLAQLQVMNNGMEELDLRNGNNFNLITMKATGNILTCISVDDPADATMPYGEWNLDLGVQISLNCKQAEEVVIIPDPAFERALIELGYDTNGGDEITGNILLSEAEAVNVLNVGGKNITDATGLEAFVNLNELDMSNNALAEINLQENTNLVSLNVSGNGLSELFISNGKIMTNLNAANNILSALNFADLTNLQTLNISGNNFQTLNFSDFRVITSLDVSNNQLVSLDLRNGNNSALSNMNASGNLLICIGVDDAASIPAGWSKDDSADYTATGDCEAPLVLTRDITVYLDRDGFTEITPADINNGSYDNVTEQRNLIFELDMAQFNCDNLGENDVNLFVTDESGNVGVNNLPAIVRVVDEIAPEASSLRSITLDLNGGASVQLDPSVINDGSTDNCGNLEFAVDQASFSFPGNYTVEFTVSDASGNFSSTMVDVEVVDTSKDLTALKFKKNLVATVYPNPFVDYFRIGFSRDIDMNTIKAEVFSSGGSNTSLEFVIEGNELKSNGTLPVGEYFLMLTINGETQSTIISRGE
ncbi:SusF/SusE family outer membrane protein [Gramella sp. KN1008]|uniref:SusF/SusE family outer membrane protein n=1 Tax=Gramella sp. KN1008 TaxID=2529298 RepID=UPI0013F1753D|nr:SusF/SusE family outer membrane protein [Gramella sp. KN1008]